MSVVFYLVVMSYGYGMTIVPVPFRDAATCAAVGEKYRAESKLSRSYACIEAPR